MRLALREDQRALQELLRGFLAAHANSAARRAAMALPHGYDAALWQRISGELGLSALLVPEAHGGLGLTWVEAAVLLEETGATLLSAPLLPTLLGASALQTGSAAVQRRWLPSLAAGATIAAVALSADLTAAGDRLTGTAPRVLHGHSADVLILPAGGRLFVVDATAPGLQRQRLVSLDATRPLARLTLDSAPATPLGCPWEHLRDLAVVAAAAEQVGAAERCLSMAVDYAKIRRQFGRPIGSFQAIKHMCADMLVQVECARSAAWAAAWAASHDLSALPLAAATAGSVCTEALRHCAGQSIQIHGGIGFTWEHDAHLYFRRARASLWGSPSSHRQRISAALLDRPPTLARG